ncbi:MAG TPA: chromosome partitioning protein [Glaciibacter sp.]|nr:chromosome partitioning protein [Glaciibacter sp.]
MTNDVSSAPTIKAIVRRDATGVLSIDGVRQSIEADDEVGVREEIIARVTEAAQQFGQPVRLLTEDAQGTWPLIVHPDGHLEEEGHYIAAPPRPAAAPVAAAPVAPVAAASSAKPSAAKPAAAKPAAAPAASAPRPATTSPSAPATGTAGPDTRPVPVSAATASASATVVESPALTLAPVGDSSGGLPTLADFLQSRPAPVVGPAQRGWQAGVRRVTGGLISPAPSAAELSHRNAISAVQRSLSGPRTIVVLNPKGGAHKTTATLLIAATFGIYRGGYTLAWDNNETMGTLGVRAQAARHTNTAVDLLRDLDRFADARSARVGDLDNYVRSQGDAQFDALASDLDPAGAASIDSEAFRRLHGALSRFYRVLVIDTGNNMRASNWEAAVEAADQLVIVSTIREDTAYGAASLLDGLRRKGHANKVAEAVTILSSPAKTADAQLSRRLHGHFRQLTRAVLDVPHDPSLVAGGPIDIEALAPRTREAWLHATAAIAEGL